MAKKTSDKEANAGQPVAEAQPATRTCKFCEQTVPLSEWSFHCFFGHGVTTDEYEEHEPGRPRPREHETATVERIPPPPRPPQPEQPKVAIRLVDCESNPPTAGVEARRGCSYFFRRGEWQEIPVPDAALLLPNELSPGLYGHLKFEQKPEKPQGK